MCKYWDVFTTNSLPSTSDSLIFTHVVIWIGLKSVVTRPRDYPTPTL